MSNEIYHKGNGNMRHYDYAVIGAGPAGSNFARLAAQSGKKILLINGQSEEHKKPCGGLLAPDAQTALAEMGLSLPSAVMVDPQIFSVKTVDTEQNIIRYYPRRYLNMDRFAFDCWLLSLVPPSVDIVSGLCTCIKRTTDGFELTVRGDVVHASSVVGADGANSLVRRTFYGGYRGWRAIKRYVAIQQWFPVTGKAPFYSCIFDAETSPVYSFSAFKDGKMLFGGMFEPVECRHAFEVQKEKLSKRTGYDLDLSSPSATEACMICRPRYMRDFITGYDGAYLIGEAAGFVSPSSFEGISYALESSRALADAVCTFAGRDEIAATYRRNTHHMRLKLLMKCVKRTAMYVPVLRRAALRSGLLALHVEKERLLPERPDVARI